jgi:hypothetical protein
MLHLPPDLVPVVVPKGQTSVARVVLQFILLIGATRSQTRLSGKISMMSQSDAIFHRCGMRHGADSASSLDLFSLAPSFPLAALIHSGLRLAQTDTETLRL